MSGFDWSALDSALADDAFGSESCLTFYLCGAPEHHLKMRADLQSLGATNLEGEDSGFVYAKVPISLTQEDIDHHVLRVGDFAAEADIEVLHVDLNSTADIERTKLHMIWTPQ